jgi:hypothetical protein
MTNRYVDVPDSMSPIDKLIEVKDYLEPTVYLSQGCFDYMWNNENIKPSIDSKNVWHGEVITLQWLATEEYYFTRVDLCVQKNKHYETMYRLDHAETKDFHYRRKDSDGLSCTVLRMIGESVVKKIKLL